MIRVFLGGLLLAVTGGAHAFDPAQQDDSAALARHFETHPSAVGPMVERGAFRPLEGETISLMGGTPVFRMQEAGFLEAALQSAFPDRELKVRNLGWPADTVHRQQRPMYFYTKEGDSRKGSIPDQRSKVEPGTFVLAFGRMESLRGEESLTAFERAYDELLGRLTPFSERLVLVGPIPFAGKGPAAERAEQRNDTLERYAEVIESLAGRHRAVFAPVGELPDGAFAANGLHLSELGQRLFATRIAEALGIEPKFRRPVVEAVRRKNHLWDQYYRPTNWAFLFGDRQHVPSSRSHRDSDRRWFVEELEKLPPMIERAESEIRKLAKGGER